MTSRARSSASQSRAAARLLAPYIAPTRLVRADSLGGDGHDVFLKLESELPTGSFKIRGALYSLTVRLEAGGVGEVVAASTGNHGAAVAYAARRLGVPATIFLPARANPVKTARIRELGGRLVEAGADLSAAIDAAAAHADATGAFFLHDASDANVPVGAGTIALEILGDLPDVDVVYVPMGDTALVRGVASVAKDLKPSIAIVGVVAEGAPAYYRSWRQRAAVETPSADTIADGLAVRRALPENVAAIVDLVDEVQTVSDAEMVAAIAHLIRHEDTLAEPAGAAGTAAVLRRPPSTRTAVILVTGRNIAPDVLARAREEGSGV
jgi:threonine dehydratase